MGSFEQQQQHYAIPYSIELQPSVQHQQGFPMETPTQPPFATHVGPSLQQPHSYTHVTQPRIKGQNTVRDFIQQNPQGFMATSENEDNDHSVWYGYNHLRSVSNAKQMRTATDDHLDDSPPSAACLYIPAIISFLCCWAIGICAICAANDAEVHKENRQYDKAHSAASKSRALSCLGIFIGTLATMSVVLVYYFKGF